MRGPQITIVVPTFNESENIDGLLDCLGGILKDRPFEIIVVDDNSPDGTGARVQQQAVRHPTVRLITRSGTRGLSRAVIDGFNAASGEIFAVLDADRSHDEKLLPQLIDHVQSGYDMAIGSRRVPGGGADKWPWYRKWMSNAATYAAKTLLRLPLSDPMSGYFAMRRSLYDSCKGKLNPTGYKILLEIFAKGKPKRWIELPYVFRDRRDGHSKLSLRVIGEYLRMLISLRLGR